MTSVYPLRRARLWAPLAAALLLAVGSASAASVFRQHNLVSDGFIPAAHTDPHLVNGWGVAFNPYAYAWVADADATVSTIYDGNGNIIPLVVQIPMPNAATGGNGTGIVYNGSDRFVVHKNGKTGAARFLFATEQGVIAAWSPGVDMTHAIRIIDNSATGASYKGLTLSGGGRGQLLYAANFSKATVDVYNGDFHKVGLPAGAFHDPNLPKGYAPFNVQAIGGDIYVSYALQNAAGDEEVRGPGNGYIDVYTPNGRLIRRVASRGCLNAPWGMVLAPAGFGSYSNALLVGNFGDGRINAFAPTSGVSMGPLRNQMKQPIHIDGLWGLAFGNGIADQPVNALFFAAGPEDESHGLYGRIDLVL